MRFMIREIEADVRATAHYIKRDRLDPRVMDAMASTPRHEFVPKELQTEAYDNNPLRIGYGQTISQPYIVALMTELLETRPDATILEVGTGSGYQAAVLSKLVSQVYSLEIIEPLAETARQRLRRLGYTNVDVISGDGYSGWPEQAPYDGILVTAASEKIPPPLIQQLKPGSKLVIPVESGFFSQELISVEKRDDHRIKVTKWLPVRFVPLTGNH